MFETPPRFKSCQTTGNIFNESEEQEITGFNGLFHFKENVKEIMECKLFINRHKMKLFPVSIQLILLVLLCSCSGRSSFNSDFSLIESGFKNIPDSQQISVYWYWLNDNISKEGVVKDLQAMKKAGINRAFIGNIGLGPDEVPYGRVKLFSDEWWEILHTALKTATDLKIDIGIFNSPGWTQSGGPWIRPEQSMRYLNTSEIFVTGPNQFNSKLITPNKDFQRVKVIAYEVPADFELNLRALKTIITSFPEIRNIEEIMDGDLATQVNLPSKQSVTVNFEVSEMAVIRSLIIYTSHNPIKAKGELYSRENGEFIKIKEFEINRSNSSLSVGFDPYAPVVLSVPETRSDSFRLVISDADPAGRIAEVELTSSPRIERYPEKSLAKMFPTPHPYWHEYMWPVQPEISDQSMVINPEKVIDITGNLTQDGVLRWSVPAGKWVIMQTGMTSTGIVTAPASPEGTGLEADKMSREHVTFHFDSFLGEIIRRIPPADRRTWKVVVADSYERGAQNWTDDFIIDFRSRFGYDPVPFIPALKGYVVRSRGVSDRFLWDLRRMVADKLAYDYLGGLTEESHKNGMTTWLENYGHWGFPGEFLQYGGQSDEVSGEFWSEGNLGDIEVRAASSCAHIYGKRKVSAESFTSGGDFFYRYPATMKKRGDRFFTEGINNTLLHVYIQQPGDVPPGVIATFGNEFNRHNTWFSQIDLFINYLKRSNFMLQQGNYVADVAYFIGEDVPKMTGICEPKLPKGYSFDYINSEIIMNRAYVRDGKIILPDGMFYRILVLPVLETMRPELLNKIKELVQDGAVVLGPAPRYSPSLQNYPACDQQVQKLASELWGTTDGKEIKSARFGSGMILTGMTLEEVFDLIKVIPDCKFPYDDPLLFIHRKIKDGDIYFITNQSDKTITVNPEFRVSGKSPELWDPSTGNIRPLHAFEMKPESTSVPLKLEAYESAFIFFRKTNRKPQGGKGELNFPEPVVIKELQGPWTVSFEPGKRGPVKPVVFTTLHDWSTDNNDSIKYYSGSAIYKASFTLNLSDREKRLFIDLGSVKVMAKVKLNGKYVGGVWTAPWRIEISDAVREGENALEVEVVSTWVNRLIGDSVLPAEERGTWCNIDHFGPQNRLDPSGLTGQVKIVELAFR